MSVYTVLFFQVGEGNGTPLQHSCLENPMDGGAWWATVHCVAKSRTRLSDFTHSLTCEREALVAVMFSKQCALLRDCRGSRAGAGGDTPAEPWELGTGPT